MPSDRDDLTARASASTEAEVRSLAAQGDAAAAAAAAIRGYGPEILGFLSATLRGDGDADDVFSLWSERIFRNILGFSWDSSLRTWAYAIARNAASNHVRGQRNRARREQGGQSAAIADAVAAVRTETPPYQRTEVKDRFATIRDALAEDDRMLLVLRVDRRLEWKDLARVMIGDGADLGEAAIAKESARLRKRYQLLKEKLIEAGKREGLIGGQEEG